MNDGAHLTTQHDSRDAGVAVPSVDDSLAMKLLPFVLSVTAGNVDMISFLGLGGLFAAHITGNLVVLAARLVARDEAPIAQLIAVPVFVTMLALTRLLVAGLERVRITSLLPLLLLQFLLLSALFAVGVDAVPGIDPKNSGRMIFAGMLGVSAMAVQNALVRISLKGAPSTAVMTTNVTVFTMDVGEILLQRKTRDVAGARDRARHTWPAIAGFLLGCALGAACESAFGLRSLVLPACFAVLALALGLSAMRHDPDGSHKSNRRAI